MLLVVWIKKGGKPDMLYILGALALAAGAGIFFFKKKQNP
ncbi:LPXTG cell wall anchor domain-containing protein [Nitrosomonas sp.]|nr:LPXTG cell wall anchor domain-containing protein [Nitrosomonas sp.]